MTDFTPDQIEAIKVAIDRSAGTGYLASNNYLDKVIAELQKPKEPPWMPKDGDPYAFSLDGGASWSYGKGHLSASRRADSVLRRPLTAAEIGLEPFEEMAQGRWSIDRTDGYNDAIAHMNSKLFPQEDK